MESNVDELYQLSRGLQTENYFNISIAALFLFDYFLSFSDEIAFIWRTNVWGLGKVLYIFARYTPFVSLPLALASQFFHPDDLQVCTSLLFAVNAIQVFEVTVAQCLFALRNYAMWQNHRLILIVSLSLLISSVTVVTAILVKFMPSIAFEPSPIPNIIGCYKTGANSSVFGAYIVIMVSESGLLISILVWLMRNRLQFGSRLLEVLLRDGVFYCVCMLLFSTLNVALIFLLPNGYSDLLTTYQSVFHTILAARLQLHLRRTHESSLLQHDSLTSYVKNDLSGLIFAPSGDLAEWSQCPQSVPFRVSAGSEVLQMAQCPCREIPVPPV